MIFFCVALLIGCLFVVRQIWVKSARENYIESSRVRRTLKGTETTDNPIKLIYRSRHLSYTSGIIGISVIVANLIDYQYSAVASAIITETDQLTAFFGFWMSTISIISLGIQLLLTGRVMKHLGVVTSLFFLPASILLGSISILANPGLWSAILLKISDGSLKQSINKAGVELLYLPVPHTVKIKVKALVDIFVDNLATGLAGVLLIVLTMKLGFSVPQISVIVAVLISIWIFLVKRIKSEYVNSFRKAVVKRSIDLDQQQLNLEVPSVLESITRVLEGDNDRQILYVLQMLEGVKNKELTPFLKKLIRHPSDEVKRRVLELSQLYDDLDLSDEAEKLTNASNQELSVEAISYVCERSDDTLSEFEHYFTHQDYRVRGSALTCAARTWKEKKEMRNAIDLEGMLKDTVEDADHAENEDERDFIKINTAGIIGITVNPELFKYLDVLLEDESADVLKAAIISAGSTGAPEFVPALIRHMTTKNVRQYARQALSRYGEGVIEDLSSYLTDPGEDITIRQRIPGVLALIGSQGSTDLLINNLGHEESAIRYEVLKALNRQRAEFPHLKLNRSAIEARIDQETENYYQLAVALEGKSVLPGETPQRLKASGQLFVKALQENLENSLERIFRLLSLKIHQEDMYNAYLGVTSQKPNLKANSIELLDNVLVTDLKKTIIPIVEMYPSYSLTEKARELFRLETPSEDELIGFLLNGENNWLKVCALFYIAETNKNKFRDVVLGLKTDRNPMVEETTRYCLERIGVSN
jgi:AAA family ATP:ADP antiporter